MNICLVTSAVLPVKKYGGTERIVQWLAEEFISLGHKVTLLGPKGSALPKVNFIPTAEENVISSIPDDTDIVHFHGWPPENECPFPWIYTLHGNHQELRTLPKNTICISKNHAERHKRKIWVYNGISENEFTFSKHKDDYLLFFSKIRRRVKGAQRALNLALRLNKKIFFAGGYRFDFIKVGGFFKTFSPLVSVLGEIGGAKKATYFSQAQALIFPIDWEEPFGLVVIEALMSGTPVVATRRGSLTELINPKVGAFFESDDEFEDALNHALKCSPEDCRKWAIENFSSKVCAKNHIELYKKVISGKVIFT